MTGNRATRAASGGSPTTGAPTPAGRLAGAPHSSRRPLSTALAAVLATGLIVGAIVAAPVNAAPTAHDVAPRQILASAAAGLGGIAVDDDGTAYVSGYTADASSIEAFTGIATTPTRTITIPEVGLRPPDRPVLTSGSVIVTSPNAMAAASYPKYAAGESTPPGMAALNGVDRPTAVVRPDSTLWVTSFAPYLQRFDVGADSSLSPNNALVYSFTDVHSVRSMAFSADSRELYVVGVRIGQTAPAVHVFGTTSTELEENPGADIYKLPLLRSLAGPATGIHEPGQIAVDAVGNLYVPDGGLPCAGVIGAPAPSGDETDSVLVFAPGAGGNAAPHTVLAGPRTALDRPISVAVAPNGDIYVANGDSPNVLRFASLAPYIAPAAARSLRVTAKKSGARTVTWTGDTRVAVAPVRYDVVVRRSSKTVLRRTTTGTSITIPRKALRAKKHVVTVTARNDRGSAAAASRAFTVKPAKPGKVRKLKVRGKATAAKRTVRWKAPKWDGGAKVKRYRVTAKLGRITFYSKTVKAKQHKVRIKTRYMAFGKYQVTVRAKNKRGYGKAAKARMTIRP